MVRYDSIEPNFCELLSQYFLRMFLRWSFKNRQYLYIEIHRYASKISQSVLISIKNSDIKISKLLTKVLL